MTKVQSFHTQIIPENAGPSASNPATAINNCQSIDASWQATTIYFASFILQVFTLFCLPWRIAFWLNSEVSFNHVWAWIALDWIFDCFFVTKLVLSWRRFSFRRGFVLDILASVPIELIGVSSANLELFVLLRLTKLLRIHQMKVDCGFVITYLRSWNCAKNFSSLSYNLPIFMFSVLSVHWLACSVFALSISTGHAASPLISGWVFIDDLVDDSKSAIRKYIRAVYFILTTWTTVGFGDFS